MMQTILLTKFKNPGSAYGKENFLRLALDSASMAAAADRQSALTIISEQKPAVFMADEPDRELFDHFHHATGGKGALILLTDLPMERYSRVLGGEEERLVQQVIATDESSEFMMAEIRTCLRKTRANDIFGMDKHLRAGTQVEDFLITGSRDRMPINAAIARYTEHLNLGGYYTRLAGGIAEEMMMNAIYDASAASGKPQYQNLNRHAEVFLDQGDHSRFSIGFDGQTLALSIHDPFGKLSRGKLLQYLRKVLIRSDTSQLIDTKEMGAGLGLYKILYSCHSLTCNVQRDRRTEVIALINSERQLRDFSRMPRSIQYFEID